MNSRAFRYAKSVASALCGNSSPEKPTLLSYLITDRCNSHCLTCNVWRNTKISSITPQKLRETLQHAFFSEIKHAGISGGEPSTFADLSEQIRILLSTLKKLETISITTNCINALFWEKNLPVIREICEAAKVYFQLNISLDGVGDIHNKIRGTENNFENFLIVLEYLKENKVPYQIHSTINRWNVYHVNELLFFAQKHKADIIFRLASEIHRLSNKSCIEEVSLNEDQLSFFCDFLRSNALLHYTRSPGRKLFYKHLAAQLIEKSERTAPCYFKASGIVLSADGTVSFCSRFESSFGDINTVEDLSKEFQNEPRETDLSGSIARPVIMINRVFWPLSEVLKSYLDSPLRTLKKIIYLLEKILQCVFTKVSQKKNLQSVTSVSILGMYGGEHAGDAAILGGVILRLKKRYPDLHKIIVFSHRKDRTERWIRTLKELPDINIVVESNESVFVSQHIRNSQRIVWGGGPMMEIPLILLRNYYFLKKAGSFGIPVEIEGIGYGPLHGVFCKVLADKIFRTADRITVRSQRDREAILQRAVKLQSQTIFCDPAFDYLNRLPLDLSVDAGEKKVINDLLNPFPQDKRIALNLRPMWNKYGHTGFDANHFLSEIAETADQLTKKGYLVIFFPMNADHFGFSDLSVACDLRERLNGNSLFRVLESEPSVNALIYLLRNVNFAICMRFHAAIFSLSQKVKTIGLDYDISGPGKVADLFKNLDNSNCINIQQVSSDQLLKQLFE